MMKRFIFGADYYIEYLPADRLETDLTLMEDAGINTIRIAESTWSVEEPREGEFDFTSVIRVIEAAAVHGIDVIVGTPTYAIPAWLARKDPSMMGENRFGSRQDMDITNPTYRFHAERIIRELVSRTAGYANVIGFQIDNETKHYFMHNERVVEGFRNWLRERFDTIEDLNEAYGLHHWSNSVASFEELPDPTGTVNGSYGCAYEEYRRHLAAEFLLWQSDIVREYKRDDQFITHNFDFDWIVLGTEKQQLGRSWGMQPDLNDYEASKAVTLAGTDIYFPVAHQLTGIEIAFGGDLIRSLKKAPYVVLESQAQCFTGWLPYPGQLRQMAFSHMASGARGMMYWPWHSIHNGIEAYWKGVLSHDGQPDETYEEVRALGAEIARIAPTVYRKISGSGKTNRIALVVSNESLTAWKWFPANKELGYNDIVMEYYRALYEENLECDVIYDRELEDSEEAWSRYEMLVFPSLYTAGDELIAKTKVFVENGGTAVAGFRSFFADKNIKIRSGAQPYGLTDVFGVSYSRWTRTGDTCWAELLRPDKAETLHPMTDRHWGEHAAVTCNDYGKGKAWYIGYHATVDELKEYIRKAAEGAGQKVPDCSWPLIRRRLGDLEFYFNYSDETISFRPEREAEETVRKDLLKGTTIEAETAIELPAWGVLLLQAGED